MNTTPKYSMLELSFSGPKTGNPFTEIEFYAEFSFRNQKSIVPGFYCGDGVYKLRFMPLKEGIWSWCTFSSCPELNGKSGELECTPPQSGSRGPVRVVDRFHFAYDDGTPFHPVGTTAYAWTSQPDELISQTLETLSKGYFNKIRMSAFPKSYMYNINEPPRYPFTGGLKPGAVPPVNPRERNSDIYDFDFDLPNYDFWNFFDGIIAELQKLGIECDLILFHPYDRWGFAKMSREQNLRYLRYVAARYGAYPNMWWSMANEWDLMRNYSVSDWEAFADEITQWDHANHLCSIHNGMVIYDQTRPWITHASLQVHDVENTGNYREKWGKPVMIDEMCYEGDLGIGFGDIPGEELTRRFWEATVRGGYATHGETFDREDEILWWAKGGKLYGTSPERIKFLLGILDDCPGHIDIRHKNSLWDLPYALAGEHFWREEQSFSGTVKSEYAEWMLHYHAIACPNSWNYRLPEDVEYYIDIIDTWNMSIERLPGTYSGNAHIKLPTRSYMAVRFIRV